jgi:hypothetical protein
MTNNDKQSILDEEHLKLLRIGYIVAGVSDVFFALFPLIYVMIGFFLAVGGVASSRPGGPNPAAFGLIFVFVGLAVSIFFAVQGALKLFAARAIGKRQSRLLCLIAAGASCMQMPWGTLLGVFTFMVLGRQSVTRMFEPAPVLLAAPPERMASTLFDEEEARYR